MVMSAPVWHLLARADIVSSSTGYHRYALIDGAIKHIDEWFWCGTSIGTAHWGFGLFDVTNHYLVQGLQGGIAQLVLFITMIAYGYRGVGRMWRAAGKDKAAVMLAWAVGVSLFIHCCNFIAVTYFGQINMLWYLSLALIGSLEPAVVRRKVARKRAVSATSPMPQVSRPPATPAPNPAPLASTPPVEAVPVA
jgi:hypothetical protein